MDLDREAEFEVGGEELRAPREGVGREEGWGGSGGGRRRLDDDGVAKGFLGDSGSSSSQSRPGARGIAQGGMFAVNGLEDAVAITVREPHYELDLQR